MTRHQRPERQASDDTPWRITFIDTLSSQRIEVDVRAPTAAVARDRGWAALRARRPPGVVAVELVDARPAEGCGPPLEKKTAMKEIKAYGRRDEINEVVERLQRAAAPGVSVIEIHPVGYGYEANPFEPHGARLVDRYRHLTIVKLEIVCTDEHLEALLEEIQTSCRTSKPGDGMVFVSEVAEAIRIRDGVRGAGALHPGPRLNHSDARHESEGRQVHRRQSLACVVLRLKRAEVCRPMKG